jgi:hypothetical protein
MLTFVIDALDSPLGAPIGRRAVRSRKTSLDKPPWKDLPEHQGVVESIFIRPAYLGESVAPFRTLVVPEAIVPYDGTRLMDGEDNRIDRYPGLAEWWRGAEAIWLANRSSEKRTLAEQIDYMHQLSAQFPVAPWRVVYTASGNTLAAAIIQDPAGVIEHKLYWAAAQSCEEARYLAAVLNAPSLSDFVRPYQSVGAFGARDFDKYVWQAAIPLFDPKSPHHLRLAALATMAEEIAARVAVPADIGFQAARRLIRGELGAAGVSALLDSAVGELLASDPPGDR